MFHRRCICSRKWALDLPIPNPETKPELHYPEVAVRSYSLGPLLVPTRYTTKAEESRPPSGLHEGQRLARPSSLCIPQWSQWYPGCQTAEPNPLDNRRRKDEAPLCRDRHMSKVFPFQPQSNTLSSVQPLAQSSLTIMSPPTALSGTAFGIEGSGITLKGTPFSSSP